AKGYTISKKTGTYTSAIKVKLKAKKGYVPYYTTGSAFKKGKKIKAGASKTISVKSTKTLSVYSVKKSKKVTKKLLKKAKNRLADNYKYQINTSSSTSTTSSDTSSSTSSSTNTSTSSGNGTYSSTEYDSSDTNTSSTGATQVTIPATAPSEKITTSTYTISKKNKLTITAPGTYTLSTEGSGQVDGRVEVDLSDSTSSGEVHIILNGVNMTSSDLADTSDPITSDKGIITIKNTNVTKAIITVVDGTTNTLADVGLTGTDADDSTSTVYPGGIVCKKTPLSINGAGTLSITSTNGNGIKCTEVLKILNTAINIGSSSSYVGNVGIAGKLGVYTSDPSIIVYSKGDGIKTTLDETDIAADSNLSGYGNVNLDQGTYAVTSSAGDGIYAYQELYLNPTSLTSKATYTSSSSNDETSSKALKSTNTLTIPSTAGTINATSNRDDALHANDTISIAGGTITSSAGDDGIHSDTDLKISGGTINVTKSYEGIEGANITVSGGNIDVVASDDGFNAGGGSDSQSSNMGPGGDTFSSSTGSYTLTFTGGKVSVSAEGDGLDSNGNMYIKGGYILVNGPTGNGNGALDYGDSNCVCEVSGGTLIALGSTGMVATPTSGSSQAYVNLTGSSKISSGTTVTIKDSSSSTLASFQAEKAYSSWSIIFSCEGMTTGSSYSAYVGSSTSAAATATATTSGGSSSQMPGGPGGR
nr:carbohydrate-binding domain-containing protein [Eubacterium sp.]